MTPKALLEKALALLSMMKDLSPHDKAGILRVLDVLLAVEIKNAEDDRNRIAQLSLEQQRMAIIQEQMNANAFPKAE